MRDAPVLRETLWALADQYASGELNRTDRTDGQEEQTFDRAARRVVELLADEGDEDVLLGALRIAEVPLLRCDHPRKMY